MKKVVFILFILSIQPIYSQYKMWQKKFYSAEDGNQPHSIKFSQSYKIFVAGEKTFYYPSAYFICYDTAGSLIWSDINPIKDQSQVYDFKIDEYDNLYAVGTTQTFYEHDSAESFFLKYDDKGKILWEFLIDGGYNKYDEAKSILLLKDKIVIGTTITYSNLTKGIKLLFYDYMGVPLRELILEKEDSLNIELSKLKSDKQDNIIIVGQYYKENTQKKLITFKISKNDSLFWERRSNFNCGDKVDIYIDYGDNLYLLGESGVFVKYDTLGNELWSKSLIGETFFKIDSTSLESLILAGEKSIFHFNYKGEQLWKYVESTDHYYTNSVLDNSNNIYLSGRNGTTGNFSVTKISNKGLLVWHIVEKTDYQNYLGPLLSLNLSIKNNYLAVSGSLRNFESSHNNYFLGTVILYDLYKEPITILNENIRLPKKILVINNYPNPFNPETTIEYYLPKSQNINLKIYNLSGQEVATLYHGFQRKGRHQIKWYSKALSSGIYFCNLQAGSSSITKKLLLQK